MLNAGFGLFCADAPPAKTHKSAAHKDAALKSLLPSAFISYPSA
jgi:hypothetical protein